MSAAEHYAEAERLLSLRGVSPHLTDLAQAHATLAVVGAILLTNNANVYTTAYHDLAELVVKKGITP